MNSEQMLTRTYRQRGLVLILFVVAVLTVLTIKSIQDGWFEPRTPLELNDEPTLVFLTLNRGCECQMVVVRGAEAQLAVWSVALEDQIRILRVDYNRRPDLAKQYLVARAPALVLLNASEEVIWKQDLGLSDEAPLDLTAAQTQIERFLNNQ